MRRLTILGTCGTRPEARRAASGFLLEYDGFRLVLDLGYATFPRLLELCDGGDIDAVVITHEHPDHCADLSALCRERYFAEDRHTRVPLYCPPGVIERVQAMEPTEPLADVFDIHPLPGSHQVGPFRLDGLLLPHHVPHAGVRLTAPGLALAYSGDAGPDPALAQLGADADLFVIGASLLGAPPEGGNHDLMSAVEAGTWATRAGAKHLLLTHFQPGSDRRLAVAEARTAFPGGQVTAADEGLVLPLAAGLSDPTGGGMRHRYATTADTPAMAALFAASHHDALTEQQRAEQGFVQGDFNAEVLRTMAEGRTLLLAEEDGKPAGFLALAATQDIAVHSPPVQALLAAQGSLCWEGRALSELPWLLYGPVLVDPAFRGRGVARGLYAAALEAASGRAELMVAFIETVNRRSWRVHVEGFGMRPLGEIAAGDRTYSVVAAPVPGA